MKIKRNTPSRYMRLLIGKRVKKIILRPFRTGIATKECAGISFDPIIIFDDGTELVFSVDETNDGSGYGITPIIRGIVPRSEIRK